MPKAVAKPLDRVAAAVGPFGTSASKSGASAKRRRIQPQQPRHQPEPKSFEEIRGSIDTFATELAFYRQSTLGKIRIKQRVEEMKDNIATLGKEYSRLAKRKSKLHELLHKAGKSGWEAFLQDQAQVDKTIKEMKVLLWGEADKEQLRRVLNFIQRNRWVGREIKYVKKHPTCFSCGYKNKVCTFTPKAIGGGVRCAQCTLKGRDGRIRGLRCPRQNDYWTDLMVKVTGRPEHIVKEIIDEDQFKFQTSRIHDVDSTFGSGKPLPHSLPKVDSECKINKGVVVDLAKVGDDLQRLSGNARGALQKISAAGQRLHRRVKKKEGSIRALVLVVQKNIDDPRVKALLSKAPPRRTFAKKK